MSEVPTFVRRADLIERGLVKSNQALQAWIRDQGFPTGKLIGNTRVWRVDEVMRWFENQPTANKKVRVTSRHISHRRREAGAK
jgi:hypothetical protein